MGSIKKPAVWEPIARLTAIPFSYLALRRLRGTVLD